MKHVRLLSFVFLLFSPGVATLAHAGTFTAASCNQSDVNAVINGPTHTAVDGDTIKIPAGSCTWTSGVTVPSDIGISIVGAGTPDSTASTMGASSSCSSTTITVSGGIRLFVMNPSFGNSTSRISCMNITSGTGSGVAISVLGTCTSSGCPNLRVDNIDFTNWARHANVGISYGINAIGDMFGVMDHNTVVGSFGSYLNFIEDANASYLGVGFWGDNSWAQPESYGSANFLFLENNAFTYTGTMDNEGSAGALDNSGGGRVVVRYNTFSQDALNEAVSWHGTESGGRWRSGRAWEFYGNTITCPANNFCQPQLGMRGGTGLTWGNTVNFPTGSGMSALVILNTYRTQGAPNNVWMGCDGSQPWDTNDGRTYYSGTISSVSGSTITVSGTPGWTTNQWVSNGSPYSIHDVTLGYGSEISANGSNTLTYNNSGGPGQYNAVVGDSIQILRATVCVDQAGGRGAGFLYSGQTQESVPANEVSSPAYEWADTFTGTTPLGGAIGSNTARVIANRNFYMESANQGAQASPTAPFNAASGVGHGTLANRPTSCTTGVAYFATDQGSWNQSDSGDQGELYLCTATNTWSLYYTPYTYPHPLTQGAGSTGPAPAPPTGVQATVQ